VFAVVIYLVLMYVLTKVIIEKNALSISLMKVFGYNNKEIKKLYLNATSIAVIVCLFLVMPIEKLTFGFIMKYAMARIEGYVELFIPLYVFAMVVGIGIATYFVINKLHIRKINKIPMGDALKDRE
jgi:putative ABC transport system permease protein